MSQQTKVFLRLGYNKPRCVTLFPVYVEQNVSSEMRGVRQFGSRLHAITPTKSPVLPLNKVKFRLEVD